MGRCRPHTVSYESETVTSTHLQRVLTHIFLIISISGYFWAKSAKLTRESVISKTLVILIILLLQPYASKMNFSEGGMSPQIFWQYYICLFHLLHLSISVPKEFVLTVTNVNSHNGDFPV